jgi:XTP/dITP diphosphohydrolase
MGNKFKSFVPLRALCGKKQAMNQLLIATNNPGKTRELHELLDDLGIELVTPSQIGLDLDVVEDGSTYEENATKKAVAFAKASGLVSLADDSGLEVDALGGKPGLYSARYGSPDGNKLSDGERRKYLVNKLGGQTTSMDGAFPCSDRSSENDCEGW